MNPVCVCGSPTHWESDFDTEDVGIERQGVVGIYTCPECGANIEVTTWTETEEEFENRMEKENGNQH